MLERKIESRLVDWKNRPDKKCLLVKGARQVGKTFSIDRFCRENYPNYIYINFDRDDEYKAIFDGNLDIDEIVLQISLRVKGAEFVPGKTAIFLDEIQNCPRARTALKFFSIDGRFDVIASGSLLGINYEEVPSFPVGYVNHLEMHSLDFEEFCWACGITKGALSQIRDYLGNKEAIPGGVHERMMELFRRHIVVGGMPAAVAAFVNESNYASVLEIQKGIIQDYLDDIAKYAEGSEKAKARACFLSIPKNLAKDHKKFQYSTVQKGGSSRKFAGSLMWLYDAGIINFCHNLSIPELPLEGNSKSNEFKVYMHDTGLLMAMLEPGSQRDIIDGNLGIYKGAIYENIIADIFTKLGTKLYYFERTGRIETDFVIRRGGVATAVEVKSADNTKSKSMDALLRYYGVQRGIKLSTKNFGTGDRFESLPLYMAMFLEGE
ncbi:MAG: AAA family ATPase [Clostridiales bacterium]|nr:AAA family ATPase [Clostridiales bacterium]